MKLRIIQIVILAMVSCAPVKVKTFYDDKNDFGKYKSFCWLNGCEFIYEGPGYYYDSAGFEKVKLEIEKELIAKGYAHNENDPGFLVDFHIALEEKTAIITLHEDREERGYPWFPPSYQMYNYLKGSLIIDFIDAEESRMVWRSHSVGYLETFPKITHEQIVKSVKEALKGFPPK